MKNFFLTINLAYYLFGCTMYIGTMWVLKFFWYPAWEIMTIDTVQDYFIIPTDHATSFFTVIVPLMFISGIIMLVTEFRKKLFWVVLIAFLGISASTFVGWIYIIPINETIKAGVADNVQLKELLREWMHLNNIRWITVTIMWAATVYYIFAKGKILSAFNTK